MRSLAVAFPFLVIASVGWHGCQPSSSSAVSRSAAAAPVSPSGNVTASACGLTILYQNNGNGEIEPCG